MKTDHVFGNHIYVISNYGVARNPIFTNKGDLRIFEKLAKKYLSPVCDMISFGSTYNQFQFLIRINKREEIENFYRVKYKEKIAQNPSICIIPETYLIFSQQVSNMLNAYAKKFNKKYNRRGGLFAARYQKILVESEELLSGWVKSLKNSIPQFSFSSRWKVRSRERWNFNVKVNNEENKAFVSNPNVFLTSLKLLDYENRDLRGSFMCLPPKRINSPEIAQLWINFFQKMGFPPPW